MPLSSNEDRTFSCGPRPYRVSSVTRSTDLKPSFLQIAPTCSLDPNPWISSGSGIGTALMTVPGIFLMVFLSA